MLQKIQGYAFGLKNRASESANLQNRLAGPNLSAVRSNDVYLSRRVDSAENLGRSFSPSNNRFFAGNNSGGGLNTARNEKRRCDIATTDVFLQRNFDRVVFRFHGQFKLRRW